MSVVTFVKFLRRGASTKLSRASLYLFIHDGFSFTTLNDYNRRKLSSRKHNTNATRMLSSSPANSKVNNFRLLTDTWERQPWYLRVCFGRSQIVQLGNLFQMSSFHRYDTYIAFFFKLTVAFLYHQHIYYIRWTTCSVFYTVNSVVCPNLSWPGGQTGASGFGRLPHQAGPGVFTESHTICWPASCCWNVWSWANGLRIGGQV